MAVYHMHAGTCGGQKMALDSLQLDLQGIVSHTVWVLEFTQSPLQ